jgi:hypothetical protein
MAKFTQRNMAAGNGPQSSNYGSLKQPPVKTAVIGTKAGDVAMDKLDKANAQKLAYIGKKKDPTGKLYTAASYAYGVKNGHIK